MAGENLDLSRYDADVTEHGLFGRARARLFEDVSRGQPWHVDLAAGRLRIGTADYRAEILGTYVPQAGEFLWAWANPASSGWTPSIGACTSLRERGATPGYAVLQQRKLSDKWVHPAELAYVCGELLGGHPVYAADFGSSLGFILAMGARLDPAAISMAYMPGVILDFQGVAMADLKACTRRFLMRLGFTVTEARDVTRSVRRGENIDVHWSKDGRVAKIEMNAGGSRAADEKDSASSGEAVAGSSAGASDSEDEIAAPPTKDASPLDREGLFQLVADEVFRDGVVEVAEAEILTRLAKFLRLPAESAMSMCRQSKSRHEQGALGAARPLDPKALYETVYRQVLADGEIDALEAQMLRGLRVLLGIRGS